MSLKKLLNTITCLLLLAQVSYTQVASELQAKLDQACQSTVFKSSNLSISVYDVEDQNEIASYRSNKVLVPASSFKLLTTFTALKHLGPDFKFETLIDLQNHIILRHCSQ